MKRSQRLTTLLLMLAFLAICPTRTYSGNREEQALSKLLKSPSIDPSAIAIIIADTEDASLTASHNPDKALVPASIMKSATTAAYISKNPGNTRLSTKVYTDGKINGDVLEGNIIIIASGDPSLNGNDERAGSADFVEEIVTALANKGITTIEGNILIDESVFAGPAVPPSWQAGDLKYAYGTGCHGFNFEKNAADKASVSNPSEVFRTRLKKALAAKGMAITGNNMTQGSKRQFLLEHKSAPVNDIMRSCMVRSDNLYAETILRLFGKANGGDGSTEKSAEAAMKHWTRLGLPMEGVKIVDGSGLSRQNRLTARFLTMLLNKMKRNKDYTDLFPRVGKEGTVSAFLKDTKLEGMMALKTGSMKGVQCYAGYKLDSHGKPEKTVVVIVNNLKDRDLFKKALANFFLEIF